MLVACAGCHSTAARDPVLESEPADCPEKLQGAVALRVSVSPREVPAALQVAESPVSGYAVAGRRILVSVNPGPAVRGATILTSTLTILPLGGTFESWGAVVGYEAAVDVIPGRLRAATFLQPGTVRAQTIPLDVVVRAGGAPLDRLAVNIEKMWDVDMRPIAPDAIHVDFLPIRHVTAFDVMDATLHLEYVIRTAPGGQSVRCEAQARTTLMSREAARPRIWDVATSARGGTRKLWLALSDSRRGPVRMLFLDPGAAHGFVKWLTQTGATHVGLYQLGVFEPERIEDTPSSVPTDQNIVDSFRPIAPEDLAYLKVGLIAEP
jgi:hypothetical protein